MSKYLTEQGTRSTPQSEPMRSDQVLNDAGGYVWEIDEWALMRRFLILGTESGSYYSSEFKATKEAATAVRKCIKEDGLRTVDEIVAISKSGRAPKNDPALFALACAISMGDKETKRAAAEALPEVARIGTHLYHFVAYAETMRGWGRTMRWAISNWYARNPEQLALQAIKYRQRDGWSHRDLLRLAHPKFDGGVENGLNQILDWIVDQGKSRDHIAYSFDLIHGFRLAQEAESPEQTASFVREFSLPREALKTEHLNSPEVWEALLENMPMTAMIRNIATMTRVGLATPMSQASKTIASRLADKDLIRKARVHPMQMLIACRTYASGRGLRGRNEWNPVASIVDALDSAFYLAFGNAETTGKNILIGVDSSGSMHGSWVNGVPGLTAGEAACAQALIFVATEPNCEVILFDTTYSAFPLTPKMRLDTVYHQWARRHGGGTNCALVFQYALANKRQVDCFLTLTDAQSWYGVNHPAQALKQYREHMGRARAVEIAMCANQFTTNDPQDMHSLNLVGFDTATPQLVSGFIAGEF